MSFGGGRDSYTLEYIIKVTNQGGASGLSQVNSGLTQVNKNVNTVAMSQEKLQMIQDRVSASSQKVIQAQQGVTKGMKGLAFGVLGVTTAGAEFVGMMSMWQQTSVAVKEAQDDVNRALKESGKNSKDYKDAVNELAKANRWARMTFRNLMLSMFDMVPFFILTINGIVKLRNAYKTLREAQAEQQAMQEVLKRSNIGLAQSNLLQNTSYVNLSKAQRIAKAEQALMIRSNELLAASNAQVTASNLSVNGSLITSIPLLNKTEKNMGLLGKTSSKITGVFAGIGAAVSGFMKKLLPLVLIIGTVVVAVEAWKNNWGGFGDVINKVGVAIGNIHPILKTTMELIAKVGLTIDAVVNGDFTAAKDIWVGGSKEMGDATTEMSEKQQKALEEASKAVQDFKDSANDLFRDIATGDKKERKDLFKLLGITTGKTQFDDAKKGAKDFFDTLEKSYKNLDEAQARFKSMEKIDILSKLGLEIDPDVMKKMRYATASALEDIIPGKKDDFNKLAKVVEKNAKASQPEFNKAVAQFVADHPGLTDQLRAAGYPDLAGYLDGLKANFQQQIKTAFTSAEVENEDPEKLGLLGPGYKKQGDGGMFKPLLDKITEGAKQLADGIQAIDWTAAGTALREGLGKVITLKNMTNLGTWIRMNMLDPLILGIQGVVGPWIDKFKKDPIGTTIGTLDKATGFISAFVAGLLGYPGGEKEMFDDWKLQLYRMFAKSDSLNTLRLIISNPAQGILELLKGTKPADTGFAGGGLNFHENEKFTFKNVMDMLGVTQFFGAIGEAWREINILVDNVAKGLAAFINDPWGWFVNAVKSKYTAPKTTKKDPLTKNEIPNLPPGYRPPGTPGYSPTGYSNLVYNTPPTFDAKTMAKDADKARLVVMLAMQNMATFVVKQFQHIAEVFSIVANSLGANAQSGGDQIKSALGPALQDVYDTMDDLANQWSKFCNSFGANSESAGKQIRKAFGSALQDVYDTMKDLAHQWSVFCNSMIANAKSAAKGINNALDGIKDQEVKINYVETGAVPKHAKGGLLSMAEGGIMSAASGRLLTTYGPRLFQLGDNPGGRESVWAIPHNNPGPTVAKIERMYKAGGSNGSITAFNGNFNFNISGHDIINETKLKKRIRTVISENMDVYG